MSVLVVTTQVAQLVVSPLGGATIKVGAQQGPAGPAQTVNGKGGPFITLDAADVGSYTQDVIDTKDAATLSSAQAAIASFPVQATGTTLARSLSSRFGEVINVRDYAASASIGDAVTANLVITITVGSNALAIPNGSFSNADIGKNIYIGGAGTSGSFLASHITGVSGPGAITLANNAVTTVAVSSQTLTWGTDSTPAFNAALAAARAFLGLSFFNRGVRLIADGGAYLCAGSINGTNIASRGLVVDLGGSTIVSAAAGKVGWDALNSSYVNYKNFTIYGLQASPPRIGFQTGRNNTDAISSAVSNRYDYFSVDGYFTTSAFYNFAGEIANYYKCSFVARHPNSYAVILDGLNYWNCQSDFITQSAAVNVNQSFNENIFIGCEIKNLASGQLIWMADTNRHKFERCYGRTDGGFAVTLYSSQGIYCPDFDLHLETTPSDAFYITGPGTSATIRGLRYHDHLCQATNSIFNLDPALTALSLPDLELHVPRTNTAIVFNSPSLTTATGKCYLGGSPSKWNLPISQFSGQLDLNGVTYFQKPSVRNAIRNPTGLGAVAGSPGVNPTNWAIPSSQDGIALQSIALGISNGMEYVGVHYSGKATAGGAFGIDFETSTGIPAAPGDDWVESFCWRLAAGSNTGVTFVQTLFERGAAGAALNGNTSALLATPTSAPIATQRPFFHSALTNAATQFVIPRLGIQYSNGANVDFTLWIARPQAEKGLFPSSPIANPAGFVASARGGPSAFDEVAGLFANL